MNKYERDRHRLIGWVMAGLTVWGGLLALGALLFGYDAASREITLSVNPVRGAIVAGCVLIFLGGWALLLRRKRRGGRPIGYNRGETEPPPRSEET
jgi:hypothetical protein